jgi:hypothetical protein
MMGGAHPIERPGQMDLTGAHGKSKMTVKVNAKGLYPGATKKVLVKVTNPWRFRVKVTRVRVRVLQASKKCRAKNLKITVRKKPFVIKAHKAKVSKKVAKVSMITTAANSCRSGRFPLKVTVRAVKGR